MAPLRRCSGFVPVTLALVAFLGCAAIGPADCRDICIAHDAVRHARTTMDERAAEAINRVGAVGDEHWPAKVERCGCAPR